MIKQEWQEMNSSKLEQEDHLKALEDKVDLVVLEDLKDLDRVVKVVKVILSVICLSHLNNSLEERVTQEVVLDNNKQKVLMFQ